MSDDAQSADIREWAAQLKDIAPELTDDHAQTIAERIATLVANARQSALTQAQGKSR